MYQRQRNLVCSINIRPQINRPTTIMSTLPGTILPVVVVLIIITLSATIPVVYCAQYPYQPGGYQSLPEQQSNGYSWASAAVYNEDDNSISITGTTYGSILDADGVLNPSSQSSGRVSTGVATTINNNNGTCFLMFLEMPTPEPADDNFSDDTMLFIESQAVTDLSVEYGSQRNTEFCSYILRNEKYIYIAGASKDDQHSTIEDIVTSGGFFTDDYMGMFMEMDGTLPVPTSTGGQLLSVLGGHVMNHEFTTFPQSIYYPSGTDSAYIVNFLSKTATLNDIVPSIDPFDAVRMNGANYRWSSEILQINRKKSGIVTFTTQSTIQDTYTSGWTRHLSNVDPIFITGLTIVDSDVIIVGYTNATGVDVGAANNVMFDGDLDGFVTKLNVNDGTVKEGDRSNTASVRLKSVDSRDDIIAGLCTDSSDVSPEYFYVVGSTKGYIPPYESNGSDANENSIQAFISKISTLTLEVMWTIQFEADTKSGPNSIVYGLSCAVHGTDVYFGGNVMNNGLVSAATNVQKSFGGTDIFVSKLSTVDGTVAYTLQIGSSGDDTIAVNKGILTDSVGNAIIVGTTTGSLFRTRDTATEASDSSNIFVMTIDKTTGKFATLANDNGSNDNPPIEVPVAAPIEAPVETPVEAPVDAPLPVNQPTSDNDNGDSTDDADVPDEGLDPAPTPADVSPTKDEVVPTGHSRRWNSLVATLCILLFFVVATVSYANHRLAYREVSTDRGKVLSYMGAFEVEDIDLKHSATGGWHCSYTGDLAQGKNRREYYTEDLNVGSGGLYRYNGTNGLLNNSSNGLGFGLVDTEFDPINSDTNNNGTNGGGTQRLIDRTTTEYGGGFQVYKNDNDATVRSGRTASSIHGDSLYSDVDDNGLININDNNNNRRSTSHSSTIQSNEYDDGYDNLRRQHSDTELPSQRRNMNNINAFGDSFSLLDDNNNNNDSKSSTWGKDIV